MLNQASRLKVLRIGIERFQVTRINEEGWWYQREIIQGDIDKRIQRYETRFRTEVWTIMQHPFESDSTRKQRAISSLFFFCRPFTCTVKFRGVRQGSSLLTIDGRSMVWRNYANVLMLDEMNGIGLRDESNRERNVRSACHCGRQSSIEVCPRQTDSSPAKRTQLLSQHLLWWHVIREIR